VVVASLKILFHHLSARSMKEKAKIIFRIDILLSTFPNIDNANHKARILITGTPFSLNNV
jgi:hypothetical protein